MILMSTISAYVVGIASSLGVVAGWFVASTKRLTEELTKERRAAYVALLTKADEVHDLLMTSRESKELLSDAEWSKTRDEAVAELKRLNSAAEFLSTNIMRDSNRQQRFVDASIHGDPEFDDMRSKFLVSARLDSHWNSQSLRLQGRRTKFGKVDWKGARLSTRDPSLAQTGASGPELCSPASVLDTHSEAVQTEHHAARNSG